MSNHYQLILEQKQNIKKTLDRKKEVRIYANGQFFAQSIYILLIYIFFRHFTEEGHRGFLKDISVKIIDLG